MLRQVNKNIVFTTPHKEIYENGILKHEYHLLKYYSSELLGRNIKFKK
jgi:hypothetical protein